MGRDMHLRNERFVFGFAFGAKAGHTPLLKMCTCAGIVLNIGRQKNEVFPILSREDARTARTSVMDGRPSANTPIGRGVPDRYLLFFLFFLSDLVPGGPREQKR